MKKEFTWKQASLILAVLVVVAAYLIFMPVRPCPKCEPSHPTAGCKACLGKGRQTVWTWISDPSK